MNLTHLALGPLFVRLSKVCSVACLFECNSVRLYQVDRFFHRTYANAAFYVLLNNIGYVDSFISSWNAATLDQIELLLIKVLHYYFLTIWL